MYNHSGLGIFTKNLILKTRHLFLLFVFGGQCFLFSQTTQPKNPNRFKVIGLPVFFFTPDTKFGGGAGGLATLNFPKDSLGARRSSVTVGVVYTQLNQLLLYFPFQLFPQNQKYWISGELGYYRYVFNYFGTGNGFPPDYIEKYDATFPRIRLNLSRKVAPGLYAGLRYAYDDFTFTRKESGGELDQNKVLGSNGGRISGLGGGINYDTRNSIFFPTQGWLVDASLYSESSLTGSPFNYRRISADAARYFKMGKKGVFALNAVSIFSFGAVPFHQMPVIGGTKRLRGYFEGKYRDKHLLILQGEYRQPLFWRLGAVAFGGLGLVGDRFESLAIRNTRPHLGAGLRLMIDKAQKINIRADYGWGYRSSGFYLTFGEAF
jgi:outer membrane protein assembly factor BamA